MGLTRSICRLLGRISHDRLTEEARAAARRLVADGFAIAIAGTTEPTPPRSGSIRPPRSRPSIPPACAR